MENWKKITETKYNWISSEGRLWSEYSKSFMKPRVNKDGYLRVRLNTIEGKKKDMFIHRLVANHFVDNTKGLETVDHIDENKLNNAAGNLQWLSRKDNTIKSNVYKVNQYNLDGTFVKSWSSCKEAALSLGAKSGDCITNCINGRTQSSLKYIWKRSEV